MKKWPALLLVCLFGLLYSSCSDAPRKKNSPLRPVPAPGKPKNIILLIGDGMALTQATAAVYWKNGGSAFEKFPIVGFHKSHAHDDLITDSAAGATAFACGKKTLNGTIGMTPDEQSCETILERLDQKGWATGMVVASSATHATPASFVAHREIRAFTDEIALDFLKTPLDCFIGGGEGYFNDRLDGLDLTDTLRKMGYVVRSGTDFNRIPLDGSKPFYLFTAEKEPPTASAGRYYLPRCTRTAAGFLKKRAGGRGFFLMVEGSQIDWALHANDRTWLKAEMLDFDKTIHAALEFAAADGETLVVVTGDHECGGMSVSKGMMKNFRPDFATKLHTGAMVPVYAYGPGSQFFAGIFENTDLYFRMLAALGEK